MTYNANVDEGWQKVTERVHEALSQFAADFGPRECPHGDWVDCEDDDCLFDNTQPKEGSMPVLTHWVLSAAVPDMSNEKGMGGMIVVASPRQRDYITNGLLHEALGSLE